MLLEDYYFGRDPFIDYDVIESYAFFPKKTSSNKRIWRDTYYVITKYADYEKTNVKILTKNEYLTWSLGNHKIR